MRVTLGEMLGKISPKEGAKIGCAFAASLAFVETWLRVEERLLDEQEQEEPFLT